MEKGFIPHGEWCLSGLRMTEDQTPQFGMSGRPLLNFGNLALGPEAACTI